MWGFPWRYEREPGRGLALYLAEGLERCRRMCVLGPRALAADGKAFGSVDRGHDGAGSSPSASSTTRPIRSGPDAPRARALVGRRRARRRSCPPRYHPGRPPRLSRRQREMPATASKTARACAKTFCPRPAASSSDPSRGALPGRLRAGLAEELMRRAKAGSHRLRRHLCLPGGVSPWRFIATPYESRRPILHSFDDFVTESGSSSRVEGPRWGAIRKTGQADLDKRPLCPGQRMRCCRKVERSVQNWGRVRPTPSKCRPPRGGGRGTR